MDSHTFSAKGISVSIDLSVGHLFDLAVERGGRTLRPLHRAPWVGEPDLPAGISDGLKRLSGDFLCAPFASSDIEAAPAHGWPANSGWDTLASEDAGDGWQAKFRLKRRVLGAVVEKILTLRDDHPFLYQEHVFHGGTGAISVAHHAMFAMSGKGRLAFSPKRLAITPQTPLEPDPAKGRFMLAYPARSERVDKFPTAAGTFVDLADYPVGARNEDFVTLVEAKHGGPGWTALARAAEADLILVLKHPDDLPVTMLWISNGGRDYAPWNGRHVGVIGIEDGRTAVGHAASVGDNPLRREGVATVFELGEGKSVAFHHVIGALAAERPGVPPLGIAAAAGRLRLAFSGERTEEVLFDTNFLKPTAGALP